MANITLGNLRDIWQGILNWVNGTDAVSIPRVQTTGSASLSHGLVSVTTAGTRVPLPSVPCREVTVIAKKSNTGSIFVGGSTVTSTSYGVELTSKDSFTFAVSNASMIYIDASVSGEGISYVTI